MQLYRAIKEEQWQALRLCPVQCECPYLRLLRKNPPAGAGLPETGQNSFCHPAFPHISSLSLSHMPTQRLGVSFLCIPQGHLVRLHSYQPPCCPSMLANVCTVSKMMSRMSRWRIPKEKCRGNTVESLFSNGHSICVGEPPWSSLLFYTGKVTPSR